MSQKARATKQKRNPQTRSEKMNASYYIPKWKGQTRKNRRKERRSKSGGRKTTTITNNGVPALNAIEGWETRQLRERENQSVNKKSGKTATIRNDTGIRQNNGEHRAMGRKGRPYLEGEALPRTQGCLQGQRKQEEIGGGKACWKKQKRKEIEDVINGVQGRMRVNGSLRKMGRRPPLHQ